MKVLLIEDDQILRKSLSYFLKANGFEVKEVDNGLDALNLIETHSHDFDVVVTDLNLPYAGGQEIVHKLKNNNEKSPKVVVLTSQGVESTELELLELGADEFITKPFSPSVLLKRLEKLTGK